MQNLNIRPTAKPGLTRQAAAEYLGVSVSTIAHSAIPFTLRGKRAMYQVEDLDAYVASKRRDPAAIRRLANRRGTNQAAAS